MKAYRWGRDIDPPILNSDTARRYVLTVKSRPLYTEKNPDIH
jgi:hypothetical protein